MKRKLRFILYAMILPLIPVGILGGCQHKLIYFPRAYPPKVPEAFIKKGGEKIEATTSQGKQVSWLAKPAGQPVDKLWIVCGGNATLALELEDIMRAHVPPGDALLFFDYPGYGLSQGAPNPSRIRESLRTIVPLAAKSCGIPRDKLADLTMVFGHSLGAAVALIAAEEFQLPKVVIMSPFTSTRDMAKVVTGLPVGWLVTHRFDNRKTLGELTKRGGKAWIIHGASDEAIPVTMGRELAQIDPQNIHYLELPGTGHNDIFDVAPHALGEAIREARK